LLFLRNTKHLSGISAEQLHELLEKIAPGTNTTPRETPVERLIEHISISQGVGFDFGKDLGVDSRGLMILGKLTADPLGISVSSSIGGDLERSRFTVVHEIGHVILGHMTYFARETFSAWQYDSMESLLGFEKLIERMEVQANRYAAFTLMPRNAFITQTILAARALK